MIAKPKYREEAEKRFKQGTSTEAVDARNRQLRSKAQASSGLGASGTPGYGDGGRSDQHSRAENMSAADATQSGTPQGDTGGLAAAKYAAGQVDQHGGGQHNPQDVLRGGGGQRNAQDPDMSKPQIGTALTLNSKDTPSGISGRKFNRKSLANIKK